LLLASARQAAERQAFIPVIARLSNYTSNLHDLVYHSIQSLHTDIDPRDILNPAHQQPVPAFLFDGLDEIAELFRDRIDGEIGSLAKLHIRSPFAVTTRESYRLSESWRQWKQVSIAPLSQATMEAAMSEFPEAVLLIKKLSTSQKLRGLAASPLMLSILGDASRRAWRLPANQSDVMRQAAHLIITHSRGTFLPDVSAEQIQDVMGVIAIDMAASRQVSISIADINKAAREVNPGGRSSEALVKDVLAVGMLMQIGPDDFRFSHLSWLQYHCAWAVSRNLGGIQGDAGALSALLSSRWGTEIFSYLKSLVPEQTLRALLDAVPSPLRDALDEKASQIEAEQEVALPETSDLVAPLRRVVQTVEEFEDERERRRADVLVVAVHGFNTRGFWKSELSLVLTRETDGKRFLYYPWDYDEFRMGLFFQLARSRQVKKFHAMYNKVLSQFTTLPEIVFVAHSFGTYIVVHALRRFPEVQCDRLMLLGSALPADFEWTGVREKCGAILNMIGGADPALRFARFVPGLGDAGRRGFTKPPPNITQLEFGGMEHSDMFGETFMKRFWLPFIRDGALEPRYMRRGTS
jgi:pimeloyl-ACP methyl ester carboxylesterase